jgi:hypothetical protein
MAHLSPNTRINRLCVLRRFSRYLSYFDPDTCIIHRSFAPADTSGSPHLPGRTSAISWRRRGDSARREVCGRSWS